MTRKERPVPPVEWLIGMHTATKARHWHIAPAHLTELEARAQQPGPLCGYKRQHLGSPDRRGSFHVVNSKVRPWHYQELTEPSYGWQQSGYQFCPECVRRCREEVREGER